MFLYISSYFNESNKIQYYYRSKKLQTTCSIFNNHFFDLLILRIYIIFTALAIITSNVVLLRKLLKKKPKTRADKMFIILSCSDTGVGLFSIPMMSLELFTCDLVIGVMLPLLGDFLILFPYTFSTTLIMIIALDRVFGITKAHVYKKYITMKVLYRVIMLCLLLSFVVVMLYIMEKTLELNSFPIIHILISGEICLVFVTIMAYIYLFHFVRSKSQKLANKRHGGINFNKKPMMTITYLYICFLMFTLPHFVETIINYFIPIKDKRILIKINYWSHTLVYSNSYANAFIILYQGRRNHIVMRKNKKK